MKRPSQRRSRKGALDVTGLRQKLNLSQQEFAQLLGLAQGTVSRWEHGHHVPIAEKVVLLELVDRALHKKSSDAIAQALRQLVHLDTLDRIVTLVHLGD